MRLELKAGFLDVVMLSPQGRRHMHRIAAGASGSMKKICRVGLATLQIPLSSLSDHDRFAKRVTSF
jgi:hypothetical protein